MAWGEGSFGEGKRWSGAVGHVQRRTPGRHGPAGRELASTCSPAALQPPRVGQEVTGHRHLGGFTYGSIPLSNVHSVSCPGGNSRVGQSLRASTPEVCPLVEESGWRHIPELTKLLASVFVDGRLGCKGRAVQVAVFNSLVWSRVPF